MRIYKIAEEKPEEEITEADGSGRQIYMDDAAIQKRPDLAPSRLRKKRKKVKRPRKAFVANNWYKISHLVNALDSDTQVIYKICSWCQKVLVDRGAGHIWMSKEELNTDESKELAIAKSNETSAKGGGNDDANATGLSGSFCPECNEAFMLDIRHQFQTPPQQKNV